MRVDLDANVRARDGEEIGSVERAIVDPETQEVTAFVVRTGAIFGRDIVVSRAELDQAAEDGDAIRLRLTKDELERLPDFVAEQYMAPPPAWVAPAGYGFPAAGYVWPVAVDPVEPMSVPVALPLDDVPASDEEPDLVTLTKGSVVMDSHGDDVGVVDDVALRRPDRPAPGLRAPGRGRAPDAVRRRRNHRDVASRDRPRRRSGGVPAARQGRHRSGGAAPVLIQRSPTSAMLRAGSPDGSGGARVGRLHPAAQPPPAKPARRLPLVGASSAASW